MGCLQGLPSERVDPFAALRIENGKLKDDKDLLTGQLQQARKHVSDAELQLSECVDHCADAIKDLAHEVLDPENPMIRLPWSLRPWH